MQILHHYLFSHRAGSFIKTMAWLCIWGVGIGVAALITVISVMNGFSNTMRDNLLSAEPHLIVIGGQLDEIQKRIDSTEVDSIHPFEQQDIIIRTINGEFSGAIAKGIGPHSLDQLLQQMTDSPLDQPPLTHNWPLGEIFIGRKLARTLGIFEGDIVTLIPPESLILPKGEVPRMENLVVSQLLSTSVENFNRQMILYNKNNSLRSFVNTASFERGFEIWLKNPDQAAETKNLLNGIGKVETWEDRNGALLMALRLEKMALSTLLSLGALITSFSIVTVLVLLLTQKRSDIGLLIAMGLSRRKTQWIFMKIGMLLSMIGMGSGMIVGLIISTLLALTSFEILPTDIYHESSIPAQITVTSLIIVFFSSLIIAFLASWLPVRSYIDKSVLSILRESL